ncbi:hypothetical protein L2E82_03123 [Cichorium intybus]|uniref:Uncharacterized protein n=1 Tax=Cichorium intybus TaxID=13427 RepID=A0ACB9H3Y5_CICIN|nr:hypothetical protein L2E82_03123 [Cichorium intybus]
MESSKRGELPILSGVKLSKTQSPSTDEEIAEMSRVPYASAVGSIMYAMTCTYSDISYALSMVSRFQGNPGKAHWIAVKNILKYLRRTKNMVLVLGGSDELKTVADSTCESEYIAASEASKEAAWLKNFIGDLGVVNRVSSKDNPADPLTKALNRIKHNQHARSIGLKDDISFSN